MTHDKLRDKDIRESCATVEALRAEIARLTMNRDDFALRAVSRGAEIEGLRAEIARLTEERDAAVFAARNGMSLSEDSIAAIRELLAHHGVPTAAFIDDHVGNAIAQRDEARSELSALKEETVKVLEPFSVFAGELFARNYNKKDAVVTFNGMTPDGFAVNLSLTAEAFFAARALRDKIRGRG